MRRSPVPALPNGYSPFLPRILSQEKNVVLGRIWGELGGKDGRKGWRVLFIVCELTEVLGSKVSPATGVMREIQQMNT